MLVQDRKPPKPFLENDDFPDPKTLTFPKWASSFNLFKLSTIPLLALTIATLFFLYTNNDSPTTFLCFKSSSSNTPKPIELPKISYSSIPPISDKSSTYSSFTSDKWVVVSVSDYPSDSLRKMTKMKGWQVVAIGNSMTPLDWELKGVLYLSMEDQAKLGFRVLDYLPYDNHMRKSVGYLFAIQHGAKVIFDGDDRGDVVGGDLGSIFDLKLSRASVMQERILQYSNGNPNRTVVNPYVHFGQRSVWPRGLPLENVGDVGHEEFYNDVFGGMQYIQQGVSNGLPDVDSVFYFTRRSGSEGLDIEFDEHAPKVALPQGMMVPLNSFNTLFHSNAFWGLMLPVSVSTMASDVLRGYWAQRLLWEVGGYVVVYPPTIHRFDKVEAYPFTEEKDFHVNVGRLIKFLVEWRSTEVRLFDKILELSYLMAKEGFWTEKDVKFTAAWLEDLLAVGYIQPKLKAIKLDQLRPTIGDGDRKEFVPRKLPSVHLAVEESETVNYEIGNLVRWRKFFGNVVVIMFVSGNVERTALEWRLLYGRVFKSVVILSDTANGELAVEQATLDQLYRYLPKIFDRFDSAEGFMFLQDNTILNYWNLLQADKTKLWITEKTWTTFSLDGKGSEWFLKQADMVKKVVSTMPVHLQVNYKESIKTEQRSLMICNSEVFYIPRQFVGDFVDLVGLMEKFDIHNKVAVPMIFMAMDLPDRYDTVLNTMIYKPETSSSSNSSNIYSAQFPAVYPLAVSSESDFVKLVRSMATGDPLLMELF